MINLIQGDCLDAMRAMPDKSVDLVVTSPPYDDMRTYNGTNKWDFSGISAQLFRVVKDGGVVVWVVGDQTKSGSENLTSFRQAISFRELGFNLHDTMIYRTNKPPLTHKRYEQEFEYMFVFSKGVPRTFNPIKIPCNWAGTSTQRTFRQDATGRLEKAHNPQLIQATKIKGNIWNFPSGNGKGTKDKTAFQHPATFPEALARDHILSWSNPDDVVLDPFMGSGTTGVACVNLNRSFIGVELNAEYYTLACNRIKSANEAVESPSR